MKYLLAFVMCVGSAWGQTVMPTSATVKEMPSDAFKSFPTTKDAACPAGYAKQWSTGIWRDGSKAETTYDCIEQPPQPLKCGKYAHIEHREGQKCHPVTACFGNGSCTDGEKCEIPAFDGCAPDMHMVTEKEWQELMQRLHKLEHPPCPNGLGEGPDCPL